MLVYSIKYEKRNGCFIYYVGVTNDIELRIMSHLRGDNITTNRYNKSYKLVEIKYKILYLYSFKKARIEEKRVKKLTTINKIKEFKTWTRYSNKQIGVDLSSIEDEKRTN